MSSSRTCHSKASQPESTAVTIVLVLVLGPAMVQALTLALILVRVLNPAPLALVPALVPAIALVLELVLLLALVLGVPGIRTGTGTHLSRCPPQRPAWSRPPSEEQSELHTGRPLSHVTAIYPLVGPEHSDD